MAAPAVMFCIFLTIPRSPLLLTRSPFTYADNRNFDNTSYEESATLLGLITFDWCSRTIHSVLDQTNNSLPYLHARNRSYKLYHVWKRACAASLCGEAPSNAKEEALGRSPKCVNAVLWRIVQANRSTFATVWFLDILLACARNLPVLAIKRFLDELEAVEAKGTTKFAWTWLVIMTTSLALRTLLTAMDYFRWNGRLQTRIRSQIAAIVFERSLLVSVLQYHDFITSRCLCLLAMSRRAKHQSRKLARMAKPSKSPTSSTSSLQTQTIQLCSF